MNPDIISALKPDSLKKQCISCGFFKFHSEFEIYTRKKHNGSFYMNYSNYCKSCKSKGKTINTKILDSYARQILKSQGWTNISHEIIDIKKQLLILKRQINNHEKL